MSKQQTRLAKGVLRRAQLVEAAAELITEDGPHAVTHRSIAKRVGCSLSATTYYFTGLEELLAEAGTLNIQNWARRAEHVAEKIEAAEVPTERNDRIDIILRACLPEHKNLETHYLQLLQAATSDPVKHAYAMGRSRLDAAVERVVKRMGFDTPPSLIIAIIDGAAVTALSEGRNVRKTARDLLEQVL